MLNITQLKCGRTERSSNLPKITQLEVEVHRGGKLLNITECRMGNTKRLGNLPKITQLKCGRRGHVI